MTNEPTRISRRVAVTALATALVATTATTPVAAGADRPELRAAMRAFLDIGVAGMQLRVHDRRGAWVGSAGVRELGGTARPPVHGRFRIGSNTKTIVATVVSQLVAEGRIGLDSPVHRHLPEFGLDRRITVRMLLQHTSGVFSHTGDLYNGTTLPGLPSTGQEWVDNRFHTYRPQELVRFSLSKPALFAPGTDWNYSNTGYTLAALLIEKLTGRSYADETRRRILHPLGMSGTVVPGARSDIPGPHAHGYYHYQHSGVPKTVDVTRQNPSLLFGAGDMISTTRDLHTFFSALLGGRLLPDRLLTEMRTPHPKSGYGLGLFAETTSCGVPVLRHNGSTIGYGALMYGTPGGRTTLTASVTTGDTELDVVTGYPKALGQLLDAVFRDAD